MIQVGDTVKFAKMPDWVAGLPEQSRRVFQFCFGRQFQVASIYQNLFELDVRADIDVHFGGYMNAIYLESEFLEEVL